MSGPELTALVLTITGLVTAIFLGIRNLRSDTTKASIDKAAGLLTGYDNILKRLEAEVTRLETARQHDRDEHKKEMGEHRAQCVAERAEAKAEHDAEMLLAYEQIDVLNTKLYILENPPPEAS